MDHVAAPPRVNSDLNAVGCIVHRKYRGERGFGGFKVVGVGRNFTRSGGCGG